MYFTIFYKNYKIDWVLSEFDKTNISKIIRNILENTTNTTILSYGNLLCERKEDLDIIYEILMNESKLVVKQKKYEYENLPNLLEESIKNLLI